MIDDARSTLGDPPPGWYQVSPAEQRWWDGARWTEHRAPFGPPRVEVWPSVLAHVGFFVFPVLVSGIIFGIYGPRDPATRGHARSALNFQITFLIVWMAGFGVTFVSILSARTGAWIGPWFAAMFVLYGAGAALSVVGAVRAARGRPWRYGVAIPFVRS